VKSVAKIFRPYSMIPLQIDKIITETPDTRSFVLKGEDVPYEPGQFLTFVFRSFSGKEERRSYSISSTPILGEPLRITVKRITNGAYSRKLFDEAKEGDNLYATGTSGYFVLPPDIDRYNQIIFFAAGSGITPVISLLKTALHDYPFIQVVLIYSNQTPLRTIFYEELLQLQKDHSRRLHIDFLFSSDTKHPRKRLNVEMIEAYAHRYDKDSLFYLCGPLEYMRTITIVLRTEGIEENRIRKEIFHVEKPPVKEMPPDALPHGVRVRVDGKEYAFVSEYPVTILQAAKALDIPIPYSCEAGQCGTCSATCISGKVWMWHNDVLLDDELAKGRVLTCTGYAVGGDVLLQF
jgi:ferredoxin-NADP reductase